MDAATTTCAAAAAVQSNALVQVTSATTSATTTSTSRNTNMRLSSSTTSSYCHCGIVYAAGFCTGQCEQEQQQQQSMLEQHHTIYFDPYTTLPEGYVLRAPRWKRMFTKLQPHRRAVLSSTVGSSNGMNTIHSGPSLLVVAGAKLAARSSTGAKLTVRNLEEFFDPAAYDDEMDVFKDPRQRENPYDNVKRRERVDRWIDNLP